MDIYSTYAVLQRHGMQKVSCLTEPAQLTPHAVYA